MKVWQDHSRVYVRARAHARLSVTVLPCDGQGDHIGGFREGFRPLISFHACLGMLTRPMNRPPLVMRKFCVSVCVSHNFIDGACDAA